MSSTPTVDSLIEAWIAAFNAHDLDRHVALYTETATLFGAVDDLKVGRDAIRSYFGGRGAKVHVAHYHPPHRVELRPDVVLTAAFVDFADGDEPMPYRVTWVLVREADGNWRIAQHHGSPRRGA
jgi:uncharacterized protein (TIGR02246 family)